MPSDLVEMFKQGLNQNEYCMPVRMSVLLTLFFVSPLVLGQASNHAFIAPLASQSLLLDIAYQDSKYIAVGERGHILLSDNGANWRQVDVPSQATLTAVDLHHSLGWAVGHDASILHSQDGGLSWQLQYQDPTLEKPLLDVLFFDQQHGIAVGAYGLFLRTRDGGVSWQKETHAELLNPDDVEYMQELKQEDESFYQQELQSILPNLNRVSFDGTTLYLAGEAGLLARSQDLGLTWQRMDIDYVGSFFDVRMTSAGRLIAAGLRGNIFEYKDGQWQAVDSGTTFTFNSILSLDNDSILIVGNNGAMLTITGEQLSFKQAEDGKALTNAVAVGGQIIAVSEVGIKSWSEQGN